VQARARGLRILAGKHFKYVKKTSEPYKRPHCAGLTACLGNRTNVWHAKGEDILRKIEAARQAMARNEASDC
jgi:hypothetical protein